MAAVGTVTISNNGEASLTLDDAVIVGEGFEIVDHHMSPTPQSGRGSKRCALITFDDGLSECYDIVYPMLKARRTPAVFFITTSLIA